MLPEHRVDEFVDYYPAQCEGCWKPLPKMADPRATRFQVTEIPPVVPQNVHLDWLLLCLSPPPALTDASLCLGLSRQAIADALPYALQHLVEQAA